MQWNLDVGSMGLEQLPRLSTQIQVLSINLFPFMNMWLCSAGYKMAATPPKGVSAFQKDKGGGKWKTRGYDSWVGPILSEKQLLQRQGQPLATPA